MWKSTSPCLTFWPSVKLTDSNWPAICDFTCTTAEASTVPTTCSSVGSDSCVALATCTDMAGGAPAAAAAGACCFWQLQRIKRHNDIETRMVRKRELPNVYTLSKYGGEKG